MYIPRDPSDVFDLFYGCVGCVYGLFGLCWLRFTCVPVALVVFLGLFGDFNWIMGCRS